MDEAAERESEQPELRDEVIVAEFEPGWGPTSRPRRSGGDAIERAEHLLSS